MSVRVEQPLSVSGRSPRSPAMVDAARQWIKETYVPMVMTSVTEEAERLCQKNGLNFTEMIR